MASNNETVLTVFKMPAGLMLRRARDFHVFAQRDTADLEAANPMVNAAWIAQFLTQIEAIDALPMPNEGIAARKVATEAVNKLLKQARPAVQDLFRYVTIAWPGSGARLSAYGRGEYVGSRRSALRMVRLMEKALAQAADDAAALDAVGYTAAKRTALETLMNQLQGKMVEQEQAKSAQRLATEQYYLALNDLWAQMVILQRTAQIAYRDDYAKWAEYRLYDGKKPKKKQPHLPIEDAVAGMAELVEKVEEKG